MISGPDKGKSNGKDGTSEPKQAAKDKSGKSWAAPAVIDWDGPDKEGAPPRDWSGWGKFPGADYLGIKREPKQGTPQKSKPAGAGSEKTTVEKHDNHGSATPDGHCPEPEAGIKDKPAAHQPQSPPK